MRLGLFFAALSDRLAAKRSEMLKPRGIVKEGFALRNELKFLIFVRLGFSLRTSAFSAVQW